MTCSKRPFRSVTGRLPPGVGIVLQQSGMIIGDYFYELRPGAVMLFQVLIQNLGRYVSYDRLMDRCELTKGSMERYVHDLRGIAPRIGFAIFTDMDVGYKLEKLVVRRQRKKWARR